MSLSDAHREFLSSQAVDVELAEEKGVRSLLSHEDNPREGVWENWANFPAILFPWTSPDGRVEYQVRPDNPTKDHRNRDRKYLFAKGMTPVLWELRPIDDNTVDVLVVEGTKQALAAASHAAEGVAVFGISGCRAWQKGGEPIPDLAELSGWDVTICLDADASHNYKVYDAGVELAGALKAAGAASVAFTRLSPAAGNAKAGLDDVLGAMDLAERTSYITRAVEEAKAAPADARPKGGEQTASASVSGSVWLDLGPYLDGTREAPQPETGARRSDGRALLYPSKAHLLVGETGIGKSWFGCAHVAAELMAGNTVVYAHFEEPNPGATISRLIRLGVPVDVLRAGLRWLDLDEAGGYEAELKRLAQPPSLVILDGVVAACGGRSINDDETVSWFRMQYVNPATKLGAAVLALHHPVKDPNRRSERGGRGSGSWINLVDGVHFQALPGDVWIGKGRKGWIDLYADKDREGSVVDGAPDGKFSGWRALGRLEVEDVDEKVSAILLAPSGSEAPQTGGTDKVAELADSILWILRDIEDSHRYETQGALEDMLRGRGVAVQKKLLGAALVRLEDRGLIERAAPNGNQARPGWLTEAGLRGSGEAGTTPEGASP